MSHFQISLETLAISLSCSWCHELNDVIPGGATYCWRCGHRADVCRADCRCLQCLYQRMLAASREMT